MATTDFLQKVKGTMEKGRKIRQFYLFSPIRAKTVENMPENLGDQKT